MQVVKDVVVREGVTAVWVTHRLEELRAADSVTLMEDGRVTLSGPLQAVRKHLRARVV